MGKPVYVAGAITKIQDKIFCGVTSDVFFLKYTKYRKLDCPLSIT